MESRVGVPAVHLPPKRDSRHCGSCGAFTDRNPEHPCPMYREEPPLAQPDPSFQVIPSRTPAELAESLRRVRRTYAA